MSLSDGDWTYLFSSPIAIGLWVAAIAGLFLPLIIGHISPTKNLNKEMEKISEAFEEVD